MAKEADKYMKEYIKQANAENWQAVGYKNLGYLIDMNAYKLSYHIDDKGQCYTDGKKIVVSMISTFLNKAQKPFWPVINKGLAAHEAQHVNSSSFTLFKEIQEWYGKYMEVNFKISADTGRKIAQYMMNALEDGRIEAIVCRKMAIYLTIFQIINDGIRKNTKIQKPKPGEEKSEIDEYGDFCGQILSYAKTGKNAPGITYYRGKRLEQEFLKIRQYIDDAVNGETCQDCYDATKKLLETVAPYIADLIRKQDQLNQFIQQLIDSIEWTCDPKNGEETNSNATGSGKILKRLRKQAKSSGSGDKKDGSGDGNGKEDKGDGQDGDGNSEGSGQNGMGQGDPGNQDGDDSQNSDDGFDDSDDPAQASKKDSNSTHGGGRLSEDADDPGYTQDEIDSVMQKIRNEIQWNADAEQHADLNKNQQAAQNIDMGKINAHYRENIRYSESRINMTAMSTPEDIRQEGKRFRKEVETILEIRKQAVRGLRHGALDTRNMWQSACGSSTIFQRKGDPRKPECAVFGLLDNSGSMGGDKELSARRAMAVIEEGLPDGVALKVAMFDAGGNEVRHRIVREWDDRGLRRNYCYNSMSNCHASGCNKDGYSIRIATAQLMQRREKKKVLIVLSDGLPSCYNSDAAGIADVAEAVKEARNNGVIVIPIMFGDRNFVNSSLASYHKMYGRNLVACSPNRITTEFCKLFKQLILGR